MSPDTFHDLLERETADAPAPRAAWSELTEGRRRLRRRHVVIGAAGLAAAVAVTVGSVLASGLGDADRHAVDVVTTPDPPTHVAGLLRSCREGNQSDRATRLIFGSGDPTVEVVVRTDLQVMAALESPGGRYWAECFVHLQGGEFKSGMTVYDSSGTRPGYSWSAGTGCGWSRTRAGTCDVWAVSTADRLPSAVAAVSYDLGDGTTTTLATSNGYVVLNVLNPLPGKERVDKYGDVDFDAILRITYLDAGGRPIAAQAFDGSGTGEDGEVVDGLPLLKRFPSQLAEKQIY